MAKAKDEITISKIIDIEKTVRYYLLQSSTASAPSKPTTNPPGGSWSTTEPNYTSGSTSTLYFVDLTVMSDDSFSYSAVSKSSSYEAAKAAYNKASNVEKTVTDFKQTSEGWQMNWDKILNGKEANTSKHTDYITFKDGNIKLGDSISTKTLEVSNESVEISNGNTVIAKFGEETRIGDPNARNVVINDGGLNVYNGDNLTSQIGYGELTDTDGKKKILPFYTFGLRGDGMIGPYSVVEGHKNIASGYHSHAEGQNNIVSESLSHAEGETNIVSQAGSHAEGANNTIQGNYHSSHAEGIGNIVNSACSHAEGYYNTLEEKASTSHVEGENNIVSRANSHAEGYGNTVDGVYSHAEGYGNTVNSGCSHVSGMGNIVNNDAETVIGKYNKTNSDALFTVGNGTSDTARSNAMVVTKSGDVQASSFNGHTCTMGTTTCTAKANTPTATHVTFPKAFASVPIVLLNPLTAVPGTIFKGCSATNITTTGFDLYVTRTDNGNTSIKWIAIT